MVALNTIEHGPRITEEDISSFERKYALILPPAFRSFLRVTNGGRPVRDIFSIRRLPGNLFGRIHLFFGLKDPIASCNLDWNIDVFSDRIPSDMIPIATTEGADKICLSVRADTAGAVFYWGGYEHEGRDGFIPLASSFAEFVDNLSSDENSPCQGEVKTDL
jgi:hypothetical protein